MKVLLLCLLFILSSCSNYIAKMHRDLDRGERRQANKKRRHNMRNDNLNFLKQKRKRRPRRSLSSLDQRNRLPKIKRRYNKQPKRYKADDLNDNGSDGSLWSGKGKFDNFLFSNDDKKRNGDIVIINVATALKNEITRELKHAFPARTKKSKEGEKKEGEKPAAPAPAVAEKKENGDPDAVHDKISTIVMEEVKKDHLLLRGRKFLIFQKRKRQVEVQALISRRDIETDNSILSDNIIEKSVTIIR